MLSSFKPDFGAVNFTVCADPYVGEAAKVIFILDILVPLSCFNTCVCVAAEFAGCFVAGALVKDSDCLS